MGYFDLQNMQATATVPADFYTAPGLGVITEPSYAIARKSPCVSDNSQLTFPLKWSRGPLRYKANRSPSHHLKIKTRWMSVDDAIILRGLGLHGTGHSVPGMQFLIPC